MFLVMNYAIESPYFIDFCGISYFTLFRKSNEFSDNTFQGYIDDLHKLFFFHLGSTRRIGVALRYCGAYVQQADSIGDSATLVAGKSHGTFALESPPSEDFGEKELENHRLAVGPVGPENLIVKK